MKKRKITHKKLLKLSISLLSFFCLLNSKAISESQTLEDIKDNSGKIHGFVNFQQHYDLDKEYFTGTVEGLFLYDWGETFAFTDLDYDTGNNLYGEFKQYIKTGTAIDITVQYGGGQFDGFTFDHVYFTGIRYKMMDFMIRYDETNDVEFHFTYVPIFNFGKFSIGGFFDVWTQDGDVYFFAEPGLWYNITDSIAVGGELEMSYNFYERNEFDFNPTVAVKYQINF